MKPQQELKLRKHINGKILKHRSITNLRNLVLFLQLAVYKEYVELATESESIQDIPGLKDIDSSTSKLHDLFGRRNSLAHQINIFSHLFNLFTRKVKFDPDDVHHQYCLQIEIENLISRYTSKNKHLLKLELVRNHETILTHLLYKRSVYNKHRELTLNEIDKLIAKFNLNKELSNKLRQEYLENLAQISTVFHDSLKLNEVRLAKRYLKELSRINIHAVVQNFILSRYVYQGIYFRVSPEAKLAIASYIISLALTNLAVTLILNIIIPNNLIMSSVEITGLIIYGATNLLPILIPLLVNKYSHAHYKHQAESRKRKLVQRLCHHANIFEYRNRLLKAEFDLQDESDTQYSPKQPSEQHSKPSAGQAGLFTTRRSSKPPYSYSALPRSPSRAW